MLYLWLSRLLSLLLSSNRAFRQRALGGGHLLLYRLLRLLLLWLLSLLRCLLYRLLSNKSLFTISDNRTCRLLHLWLGRLLSLLLRDNRAFRQSVLGSGYLLLHRLMRLLSRLLYRLLSNKGLFTVSDDRTSWLSATIGRAGCCTCG